MLPATNTITVRQLLAANPEVNNAPDVTTPEDWQTRRTMLEPALWEFMGTPSNDIVPAPKYTVLDESETDDYRQLKISYDSEPGEAVRAYLLLPHRPNGGSVLCLHGTSPQAKDTQLGAGELPNRDWARFLSRHGFITLSPDHVCAGERLPHGERAYETRTFYQRHPHWSAFGKMVWDGARALDILETVEGVDSMRLGCIGHSLGGYGSIWLAAFDERIRAAVSSCGFTTWQDNPQRYEWTREEWYIHMPKLRPTFKAQEKSGGLLPVDMHEYAALIAPRAFLNISGMTDQTYNNNQTLPAVGLQLNALWELLDKPEKFAQFLMGAAHDVPDYSRLLALGWLEQWLKD
nr:hypothetical protein [uncultured bacterium]